jgi:hypothetical protein
MIARGKLLDNATTLFRPGLNENEEDLEFWTYYLTYYKHEVLVDDLGSWNDEQVDYYRRYGNYQEKTHMKRRRVLEHAMKAIKRDKVLWSSIGRYVDDTDEIVHFMSIVQTRSHAKDIRYE